MHCFGFAGMDMTCIDNHRIFFSNGHRFKIGQRQSTGNCISNFDVCDCHIDCFRDIVNYHKIALQINDF